ncbi:hypothetical protein [Neobacillus sp. SAB-20_R2A]|uniref:hypothetical protein n=1 Tax=Neobacillus sp. SAB-20_R2A TaxID=3120519 RepID=UPI003C6E424A
MDKGQLQKLVERIARELIEQETPRIKVLFVFCDSSAHEPFVDQLMVLKKHPIDYDFLLLDGETSGWLGGSYIQATGAGQVIAADEYAKAPIELPKDYDAIVIPEIDLDNAARVCQGLKGSVKSEIIFAALVLQKPVMVGGDSSGIKRADRRTLKTLDLPLPLKKRFESYKQELTNLGIRFFKQSYMHKEIISLFFQEKKDQQSGEPFIGKVLTVEWLTGNLGISKTLMIRQGTILTPLAKDFLREKGVKVIEEGADG